MLAYPDPMGDAATLFEQAKGRLSSFTAVGFTEDFANSLLRISHSLGCPEPRPFEAQNVNSGRLRLADVDRATLNLIHDLTDVDRRHYEFARSSGRDGP